MKRVWLVAACAALLLPTVTSAAPVAPPKAASITGLSIRAGSGRAEVVIALEGDVDVQDFTLAAPHRVVIDFHGASLGVPARLYDGIARAGITNVRVAQYRADVVRIVLDLDGPRDYELVKGAGDVRVSFSTETAFAPWSMRGESVAPVRTAPTVDVSAASSGRTSSFTSTAQSQERRITVAWRNASIRDVAQDFAVFAGRSIVVGSTVNALISAEIIDQPWDVALNSILRAQGLAATSGVGGIITIDSYQSLQSQAASEPLSKEIVPLNYAKAEELVTTIQALLSRECGGGSVQVVGGGATGEAGAATPPPSGSQASSGGQCAPRGSVVAEKQSNTLIIFEVGSRIAELISYAKSFDFKTQQVNIRAKIISISRTGTDALGLSYDLGSASGFFNTLAPRTPTGGGAAPAQEFQVGLGGDAFAGVANANRSFNSELSALSVISSTTLGGFTLSAFIDALTSSSLADLQAEPSVNTMDKREAELFVGRNIAYIITPPTAPGAIQAAAPQLSNQEVGIRLTVTPSISANRMIRMTVAAEQSSLIEKDVEGADFAKTTARNEVMVRDGETLVIAGLTQTSVISSRRGIPFLLDLPVIGRLFSQTERSEVKSDLLILITPHILDDDEPPPVRRDQ